MAEERSEPQPPVVRVSGTAHQPTIVSHSNYPDGRSEIVVGHPEGQSVSENGPAGTTQVRTGPPTRGEANVPEALHRFKDALNAAEGGEPKWSEHVGSSHISIDGSIRNVDGRELSCQVRRVEPPETLRELGQVGLSQTAHSDEQLREHLLEAVLAKDSAADRGVVLVLDTHHAPAYTHNPSVADEAIQELQRQGLSGRWLSIWLIGPTTALTREIDGGPTTKFGAESGLNDGA